MSNETTLEDVRTKEEILHDYRELEKALANEKEETRRLKDELAAEQQVSKGLRGDIETQKRIKMKAISKATKEIEEAKNAKDQAGKETSSESAKLEPTAVPTVQQPNPEPTSEQLLDGMEDSENQLEKEKDSNNCQLVKETQEEQVDNEGDSKKGQIVKQEMTKDEQIEALQKKLAKSQEDTLELQRRYDSSQKYVRELKQFIDKSTHTKKMKQALEDVGGTDNAANLREFGRLYLSQLCHIISNFVGSPCVAKMALHELKTRTMNALGSRAKRNGGVLMMVPREEAEEIVGQMRHDLKDGLDEFFIAMLDEDVRDITYEKFIHSCDDLLKWYNILNDIIHECRLSKENIAKGVVELKKLGIAFGETSVVADQVEASLTSYDVNSAPAQAPKSSYKKISPKRQDANPTSTPPRRPAEYSSRSAPTPRTKHPNRRPNPNQFTPPPYGGGTRQHGGYDSAPHRNGQDPYSHPTRYGRPDNYRQSDYIDISHRRHHPTQWSTQRGNPALEEMPHDGRMQVRVGFSGGPLTRDDRKRPATNNYDRRQDLNSPKRDEQNKIPKRRRPNQ